ncbi:MAG: (Fe-S)-binding protein [Nitrospinales bacterium]|nr:(Fe-S)-binding protein [Nitrospinales bacterium]
MNTSKNRAFEWVSQDLQPFILGFLIALAVTRFFFLLWPKCKILLQVAPEDRFNKPITRLWNTVRIAIFQTKILKETKSGWMHAFIFWGFLVLLLRALWFFFIGFFPTVEFSLGGIETPYALLKDLFIVLVSLAAGYALYRRVVTKPERLTLSVEGIVILSLILLIMVSDALFDAGWQARNSQVALSGIWIGRSIAPLLQVFGADLVVHIHNLAYWTHVVCVLYFLTLLPNSKHLHIVTSIPNVFFSRLPERGNGLHRINFENEEQESFGVSKIDEFSWKKLLDLHSCTECGRCDVVCPALASGKPLSPKQLTVDLRDHLNGETPYLLGNILALRGTPVLLGGVINDETLWSCTTCGACEEECPVMIEYVNKVVDLRRGLVLMENRYPTEFVGAFKSLETQSNPWGFGRNTRSDWAKELDVKTWDKHNPTEYLYFVGCNGAFDSRGKKIAAAVVHSLKSAGVDFSILGNDEGCTGDPARRAGNEYLFDLLASRNAELFKEKSIIKIVTHCPHCFNSLKNEYSEFGVELDVIHHSELLEHLVKNGKSIGKGKESGNVVYHDSCYLGRHNKLYDAPREIVAHNSESGKALDVDASRERGTCCGAGGGRFLLEEKTGARMSHQRVDQLMESNPDTIAVSCPFCVLMLEDALKAKNLQDKVKVKDISELANEA